MLPVLALLLTAGCAGQSGEDSGEAVGAGPATSSATPTPDGSASSRSASPGGSATPPGFSQIPPPTITPGGRIPTVPTDSFKPVTVRGKLVDGVYPGCLELVTEDNVRYALIGAKTEDLHAGQRVELRAMPAPQVRSSCDGAVLQVRDVRDLA